MNFWEKLPKPFFVLAPMADVTDVSFRMIISKYSKYGGDNIYDQDGRFILHKKFFGAGPDVFWTEFVSADGLVLAPEEGKKKLLKDLEYNESERPIVAQLFSSRTENMEKAVRLCKELGFNGIDINMGCPDKSIEKQGCGSAMIKTPKLAREIIRAAKRGAEGLPVSVKTRIGYNKNELDTWLPELLAEEPSAITIHCRTRKEMSKVPARWEHIKEAVKIRDGLNSKTLIIGNGDVLNMEDARAKARASGADGVMLGRAIFGNPWIFRKDPYVPTLNEKLKVLLEHTKLFEEKLGGIKSFALMKKHYKSYLVAFPETKELRIKLMETKNFEEVNALVQEFLNK